MFDYSKAHKSKQLSLISPCLSKNFKMATPVRNRPIMHCKPLSFEYFMYVYGLCLLFDFATKNLHFATIFYHLVDKCDLRILLILSPGLTGLSRLNDASQPPGRHIRYFKTMLKILADSSNATHFCFIRWYFVWRSIDSRVVFTSQ